MITLSLVLLELLDAAPPWAGIELEPGILRMGRDERLNRQNGVVYCYVWC